MTKRQAHPDNELIDEAGDLPTPHQGGSSGGGTNRLVGSRAELKHAKGDEPRVERVTGKDDPDFDARKGGKTLTHMPASRKP